MFITFFIGYNTSLLEEGSITNQDIYLNKLMIELRTLQVAQKRQVCKGTRGD